MRRFRSESDLPRVKKKIHQPRVMPRAVEILRFITLVVKPMMTFSMDLRKPHSHGFNQCTFFHAGAGSFLSFFVLRSKKLSFDTFVMILN